MAIMSDKWIKRMVKEKKMIKPFENSQIRKEGISYGVIKMNIDTDLQFAFTEGSRDYILKYKDYLKTQIGNPEGDDLPNKKYYDPRKWMRDGELTFYSRLKQSFSDLNNIQTL